MKRRNPLFVAGFPYLMLLPSYIGLQFLSIESNRIESIDYVLFAILFGMLLIGAGYSLYWQISTAKVLRRETGERIPLAILLVIPFANYWWLWRYSQAAEKYTKGKMQGILAFLVLATVGSIGMGIIQDSYNRMLPANKHDHPEV